MTCICSRIWIVYSSSSSFWFCFSLEIFTVLFGPLSFVLNNEFPPFFFYRESSLIWSLFINLTQHRREDELWWKNNTMTVLSVAGQERASGRIGLAQQDLGFWQDCHCIVLHWAFKQSIIYCMSSRMCTSRAESAMCRLLKITLSRSSMRGSEL